MRLCMVGDIIQVLLIRVISLSYDSNFSFKDNLLFIQIQNLCDSVVIDYSVKEVGR